MYAQKGVSVCFFKRDKEKELKKFETISELIILLYESTYIKKKAFWIHTLLSKILNISDFGIMKYF